ncbi:MAG: ABC transporter permease subunit [Deltaproteobacteria bacterium]|nr:ABC transporter permease subunit [Deltaproteobacteria bacterium]
MGRFRQAWLVARFDLGTALRTRRALAAVLLYVLVAVGTGAGLVWVDMELGRHFDTARVAVNIASTADSNVPSLDEVLSKLPGVDAEMARHLLDMPLIVLGYFSITLFLLPFLVALVSFDIVNSEVRNRSARFVLLRCSRTTLLSGKFLSHGLLLATATLLANVAIFFYAWWRMPDIPAARTALLLGQYWALSLVVGFCYLSLATLVSSLVDGGGLSMVAMFVVLIALSILSSSDAVGFLSPSNYKLALWSPEALVVLGNLAALAAFGTGFLALAWLRIRWRDL